MLADSKAGAASSKAPRLGTSSSSSSTATGADFFSSRSSTDRSSSVADGFSSNSDDNATSHSFGASSSITTSSALSPTSRSPWACQTPATCFSDQCSRLVRSLVREEGHIYSLAASGDLLYTGSDSKNIRVWKNQREFSVFKSNSGLVKSIVISGGAKIFTGHQDGKIRVWKTSAKNPAMHKRIGTLPTLKAFIRSSLRPSSYVEARRSRSAPWIRHLDAISSLSLSEDGSMLYSASWDRTVKVWRVSNFKCLESIAAHDDAVNAVVCGFDGLVFSGSADGTVKAWRREMQGKGTRHFFSQTLLKQDSAVTALAVNTAATTLYSGSSGGHVHFWERGDFSAPSGQLGAHRLAVLCLATAGSLVLSGSADTNICVWMRVGSGPEGHVLISTLTGHSGPVKCLAMEKDKESGPDEPPRWVLYSGSLDKSVKIWRVSEHAPEEQSTGEDDPNAPFW